MIQVQCTDFIDVAEIDMILSALASSEKKVWFGKRF